VRKNMAMCGGAHIKWYDDYGHGKCADWVSSCASFLGVYKSLSS